MMADYPSKSNDVVVLHRQRLIVCVLLFGYLGVLVVGTIAVSTHKLFWFDELFTYYIATLPSLSQVWSALSTGQDQTPPAYFLVVRESLAVFGDPKIGLRLPSLIGFLLMIVALFNYTRFRLPPIYAALAALFPTVTIAYDYPHEARPYGLELGFAALALLCWQRGTGDRKRVVALIGLWFSLAAAISLHYYGVLLLLPLVMGEAARTIARKRIDFAVWACFIASILPLVFSLQLILTATKGTGIFWSPPHWSDMARFYIFLLTPLGPALVATLTIAIIVPRFVTFDRGEEKPVQKPAFPNHEIVAIVGFIALPFFGVVLAKFITKAFTVRYVLSAVIGLSILFALAIHKMLGGRFYPAVGIAVVFIVYLASFEVHEIGDFDSKRRDLEASMTLLGSTNKDLPIVIGDPISFVGFSHYAPPDLQTRLIYLSDVQLAGRFLGSTSVEISMIQLVGPWFHMKVVPFEMFLASRPRFLVYGAHQNWVNRAISDRGFKIEFSERPDNQWGKHDNQTADRYLLSVAPSFD
jgi:hypothetical protein